MVDRCRNNHPYTPENTYWQTNGTRQCRTCRRRNVRKWNHRRRGEPAPKVPLGPFADWLRGLGLGADDLSVLTGISVRQVWNYTHEQYETVALDVVDRALLEAGLDTSLDDLYPLEAVV